MAREEVQLDASTRAGIILESGSSPCAVIEFKRDPSPASVLAATRQALEDARSMIRERQRGQDPLQGRMWPFAITVCGQRVDVSACFLQKETETTGRELPVVVRVYLGKVPVGVSERLERRGGMDS